MWQQCDMFIKSIWAEEHSSDSVWHWHDINIHYGQHDDIMAWVYNEFLNSADLKIFFNKYITCFHYSNSDAISLIIVLAQFECSIFSLSVIVFMLNPCLTWLHQGQTTSVPCFQALKLWDSFQCLLMYCTSHHILPDQQAIPVTRKISALHTNKLFRKLQTSASWFWHDCPKVPKSNKSICDLCTIHFYRSASGTEILQHCTSYTLYTSRASYHCSLRNWCIF